MMYAGREAAFRSLLVTVALMPGGVSAQVGGVATDTAAIEADSSDVLGVARAAQARYERARLRHLPLGLDSGGGDADEVVGRFWVTYGEGEWFPTPEATEAVLLRAELIAELDSLQGVSPGDGWILSQRVWYRSEGSDWTGALSVARACGSVEPWWCRALEGLSLHGLGRYSESAGAFEDALSGMDPGRSVQWRVPERAVEPDVRKIMRNLEESPDSLQRILDRLWELADPLYLVEGNDRLTAHYARWTVSTLRERARNPHHIAWGRDLEELTIRHGWEMGWERTPGRDFSSLDHVIGHKHPEGRDYMPSGRAVVDPLSASASDLTPDKRRPRSLYAPAYAPVLLPMDGQLAAFPRGDRTVFVATYFLPSDTTYHSNHGHPLPFMEAGDQAGMPDRIGLFVRSLDTGELLSRTSTGSTEGVLRLEVPTGSYLVSIESWSPERRRAGRRRLGVAPRIAAEDVTTLSDILLLRRTETEPTSLEEALDATLPRAEIRPGQTFAIAWEVAGLGFRPETLDYEVSVAREDRGLFRRIGEAIGLTGRPQPIALGWEEPGPARPGPDFRHLSLDLPRLESGDYVIRLVLKTANRSDAMITKTFRVVERN